jgi:glucan phosphoethanolaminetransferase (alkaline phosphatase superfamily)
MYKQRSQTNAKIKTNIVIYTTDHGQSINQ